jgi:hypothetical protein
MTADSFPELPADAFAKEDPEDDAAFYASPRMVTHIDAAAITALTGFYRETLPAGGMLLDLMSSWVSHLPPDVAYGEIIGHGMNAEELGANPRLDRWFVQDLNKDPTLPLAEASLDGAMICVGVQYLQRPLTVLRDLARVLRPGAPLVISWSNRCFPTKAVAIWRGAGPRGHAQLIELYLQRARFVDIERRDLVDGRTSDPLTVSIARAPSPVI